MIVASSTSNDVTVGRLAGSVVLKGESVTAEVTACSAGSAVHVDGSAVLWLGCVATVTAADGSTVTLEGSTAVVGAASGRFVLRGSDATVRVTTASVVLDGFDGVVVGGAGASLTFEATAGTSAAVVGDECGVAVGRGKAQQSVAFAAGAGCAGLPVVTDTQHSASRGTA